MEELTLAWPPHSFPRSRSTVMLLCNRLAQFIDVSSAAFPRFLIL